MLKSRVESSNLKGIQVAPSAPHVNHLLFADDSLLLFKASVEGAVAVSNLLDKYCSASGQRINHDKSSIFSVNDAPKVHEKMLKGILFLINN